MRWDSFQRKLAIQIINKKKITSFELNSATYDLSEIIIRPAESSVFQEFGITKISKWTGGLLTKDLTQIAVYIENPENQNGLLKDISFYITKSGKPKTPFRLRIYSYNTEKETIGSDILRETVILTPHKKSGWNTFDMSQYNIELPRNGLLIAVEWILTKDKYWYEVNIHGNKYDCYGIVIGNTWAWLFRFDHASDFGLMGATQKDHTMLLNIY